MILEILEIMKISTLRKKKKGKNKISHFGFEKFTEIF